MADVPTDEGETALDEPLPEVPAHALDGFPETPVFDHLYATWKTFYAARETHNGNGSAVRVGALDEPADPVTAGDDPVVIVSEVA